jgi:two-component system sensor histidine kinase QseC
VGEDDAQFRVGVARTDRGWVFVGTRVTRQVRLVQRTRWAVAIAAALLVVVFGVVAWIVTGRATREMERLAEEVATIEAGTLARRLSPRETIEVDRLVSVFNRVLARLERSVGQMRRFSADAAHELRTPLAALRTRLEVGLRRGDGDGAVPREVVVDALEQAERLGRLAEDLLTLARLEGGAVAPTVLEGHVSLGAVVREVGAELQPVAEEQGRSFRWTASGALPVRGSEPLLKRVVLNLVDNAFRHSLASAAVALEAGAHGERAVLTVRDEGPGIAPDVLPQVFERFRHGAGSGTGLGLALVREIVEYHGGTVELETPGSGVLVRVTLPLAVGARSSRSGSASS